MLKKTFLLIAFFLIFSLKGGCEIVHIGSFTQASTPVITASTYSVTYTANYLPTGKLIVFLLTPLGINLVSTSDPSTTIPMKNIYLTGAVNGEQQCTPNTEMAVETTLAGPGYTNINISIKNMGAALPAGNYNLRFNARLVSGTFEAKQMLTVPITIPSTMDITSTNSEVQIALSHNDVFNANATVVNQTDTVLNIKTNKKWKLNLDTTALGTLADGTYSFRVKSVKGNVTSYITEKTELKTGQQYLLASGNATMNAGVDVPTSISVEYSYQNPTGMHLKEGVFINQLIYRVVEQ